MNTKQEFSFEELRRLALAHQVKDNKTVIGIWAKLNGYSKRRKQRDNKVYTVYIKMNNDTWIVSNEGRTVILVLPFTVNK